MGNEGSSFQPHAAVSKAEIEALQKTFPGKPSANLWGKWTEVFEPRQVANIEKSLKSEGGVITFQNYQRLFGDVVKGDIDMKIAFMLLLVGESLKYRTSIDTDLMKKCLHVIVKAFLKSQSKSSFRVGDEAEIEKFVSSLLHDLIFPSEKRKTSFSKVSTNNVKIALDEFESLILKTPVIESILADVLRVCFQVTSPSPSLIPSIPGDTQTKISLLEAIFLNNSLPHELRQVWRPLFNTDTHGESFSKLAGAITKQGPTLVIVSDEAGNKFGGFATDPWAMSPKFCGKPETFLFHLSPKMNIYDSTPFNSNYQYFNLKQKTMPNGLGMGGQLEYFGFWIDNEFGIVNTSPSCSTYHSPQLGETEGKIRNLEVFGVGELKIDEDEAGPSVLDMDPEAQAVLEMMGKTFHSKVIREVDEEQEKKREMEKQHE